MFRLLKRIYSYINIGQQFIAIFFISLSTGIGMLIPQVMRIIIDDIHGKKHYDKLTMIGMFLVGLTVLLAITEFIQSFIVSRIGEDTTKK